MTDKPTPTDAELKAMWQLHAADIGGIFCYARAVLAKWGQPAQAAEPTAYLTRNAEGDPAMLFFDKDEASTYCEDGVDPEPLLTPHQLTQAQAGAVPLTGREIELIDGMIQVQLDHASRCDAIANRSMADKQKGWDMERVALLQKIKDHGIKGGQHGAE